MQQKIIKIGSRGSELALFQAQQVSSQLQHYGCQSEIVPINTKGDKKHNVPLYAMGITGIFTRALDAALLNGEIDLAVHSLKDVPTILPQGIVQAAVLKREEVRDVLVIKEGTEFDTTQPLTIATSSLRRRAQWLNKYAHHRVVDIRGNVNTRLAKLAASNWQAAIFSKAGLSRLGKLNNCCVDLSWMLPAPAQGTIVVHCLAQDAALLQLLQQFNDQPTQICTSVERSFLQYLQGGCTAPIGALAQLDRDNGQLEFRGNLLTLDGRRELTVNLRSEITAWQEIGGQGARQILAQGGGEILQQIKAAVKPLVDNG